MRMECGNNEPQSNRVKTQKEWVIPVLCPSGLSFVKAALRTLSQQKHWG